MIYQYSGVLDEEKHRNLLPISRVLAYVFGAQWFVVSGNRRLEGKLPFHTILSTSRRVPLENILTEGGLGTPKSQMFPVYALDCENIRYPGTVDLIYTCVEVW